MKRSALLLASTAMLLAGPAGAGTNAPLHHPQSHNAGSNILLAQQEGELPAADDPQAEELFRQQEKEAEAARRAAQEEAEQQLEEQRAAEKEAKREADRAAQEAAETQKQVEEEARRQADREAAKQVEEAEKRAQDEKAKRITEEEQRKTESQLEKRAERAKKETDAEIRATERTQEEAAEQAKRQTRAAQREAEKEAEKAAEQAKRQADKALRPEQEEQPAPAPDPERAPAQKAPEEATPEQPAQEEQPLKRRQAAPDEPAAPERAAPTDEQTAPPQPSDQAEQPAPKSDDGTRAEQPSAPPPATEKASPQPENAAPALDSAKEAAPAAPEDGQPLRRLQRQPEGTQEAAPADQAEQPAPPPANDAEAQRVENPVRVESIRAEEGTRVERAPRWERPRDVQVLQQSDDRTVVEINNNIYVESPDRPRLSRDAREVYYEDLPRQRVRETIVRPNGVQIVTIRNRYGDVIQRSRIMPDGNEILLSYAPDDDREELIAWRDPGEDLPPLRLAIPEEEYIFDDPDAPEDEVYAFLSQPPVERVERTYSIDEVKRSARLRDKLRRIDLDTITFGFGSAEIAEDQIARMENVANAMLEILKKNPAETFLIEGHTDAVGSDRANLVLSDRRAEAVAEALTNVFEIPPENMSTQGYGERYLKINTQGPEQENRRVAIRRITPLVAPVASR